MSKEFSRRTFLEGASALALLVTIPSVMLRPTERRGPEMKRECIPLETFEDDFLVKHKQEIIEAVRNGYAEIELKAETVQVEMSGSRFIIENAVVAWYYTVHYKDGRIEKGYWN